MTPIDRSRAGAWAAYSSYFGRSLSAHLAYASAVWVNLFAMAAGFAFTILVWRYAKQGAADQNVFYAYLCLAFSLNFTLSMAFERYVGERIREGLIATDLLKPVDYTWLFFFQASSDIVFQAVFGLVTLGVAWFALGAVLLPASGTALAWAALSGLLAFWLQFHLGFLFVQMIFATHSNYGPFTLRMLFHTAFSGIFAPISVYPPALQKVAMALPFHHVIHTPVAIYQGSISGAALGPALLGQALWGLGLFAVSRFSFGLIRRYLTIQGG